MFQPLVLLFSFVLADQYQAQEVQRLIRQLGSQRFAERDAASKGLDKLGEDALDALRRAVATTADGEIRRRAEGLVRDIEGRCYGELRCLRRHVGYVYCSAFSPDGRRAFSGGQDGAVRSWNVENGQELRRFVPVGVDRDAIRAVAVSPDGRLVAGAKASTIFVWDAQTGLEWRRFDCHWNVTVVRFSHDGQRLYHDGVHGSRLLGAWKLTNGEKLPDFPEGSGGYLLTISADARFALCHPPDEWRLQMWDVENARELRRFGRTTPDSMRTLALSPDASRALSCDSEGMITIWDTHSGEELIRFEAHKADANAVAFLPCGLRVISASAADKAIRIWDVRTGQEIRHFAGHKMGVSSLVISPDGRRALTTAKYDEELDPDLTLRLWGLPR